MPRAKDNRKPVGTEICTKCGEVAEFFQVQRGPRIGGLYRKGCECKPKQNALPYEQVEWLNRMKRTPHPMIPFPYTGEGNPTPPEETPREPQAKPQDQEPPEPQEPQGGNPKTESRKTGLIGLALLVGSVAVAVLS